MPAFEVLPSALAGAAVAVRAFARDVGSVPATQVASGSAEVDEAVADLARALAVAGRSLEERSSAAAWVVQSSAEHLGELERRLSAGGAGASDCLGGAGSRAFSTRHVP